MSNFGWNGALRILRFDLKETKRVKYKTNEDFGENVLFGTMHTDYNETNKTCDERRQFVCVIGYGKCERYDTEERLIRWMA